MSRTDPQLNFRLPAELRDWLKERAAKNGRSQSSELAQLLQEKKQAETVAQK